MQKKDSKLLIILRILSASALSFVVGLLVAMWCTSSFLTLIYPILVLIVIIEVAMILVYIKTLDH
jgi:hypothetical protein